MTGGVRIDQSRDFTEIAKDLHAQFKETGGKGGVRMDGQGLYVKNNSEFWDKHIALTGQSLKDRFDKFDNAARALSDSMDREFKGVFVGDKTVGEYVLGNFLESDGAHRVDEAMLTGLEEKLREALSIALAKAFDEGDQHTITILSNRQQVLEAVERHKDAPDAAERQMEWRDKVAGYTALRDALAEDLHAAVSYSTVGSLLGELADEKPGPDFGQDPSLPDHLALRPQADEILRNIDVLHMGLTNASINKVMKALSDVHENSKNYETGNFKMLEGLYDKVRMNNAIDAEVPAILELGANARNIAHQMFRSHDMDFDQYTAIDKALKDTMNTIASLKACRADGMLYNDEKAQSLSLCLDEDVAALFDAMNGYAHSLAQNVSDEDTYAPSQEEMEVIETLKECTVKAYDFAKSLLPVEDRLDPSIGVRNKGLFEPKNSEAVYALMEQSVREDKLDGEMVEPLQRRLKTPISLYQSHPTENGVLNPIDNYNENIELVKDMIKICEITPDPDYLYDLRVSLDMALQSYYHLSAHLQCSENGNLGKNRLVDENDQLLLKDQGLLLQQLSWGVDALIELRLREDLEDSDVESLISDSREETLLSESDIDPDDVPDVKEPRDNASKSFEQRDELDDEEIRTEPRLN